MIPDSSDELSHALRDPDLCAAWLAEPAPEARPTEPNDLRRLIEVVYTLKRRINALEAENAQLRGVLADTQRDLAAATGRAPWLNEA